MKTYNIHFNWKTREGKASAGIEGVNFEVHKGEIVAIVGKSGSGKSTLLQVLAGFMKAEQGSIKVNGKETAHLTETESPPSVYVNSVLFFKTFN